MPDGNTMNSPYDETRAQLDELARQIAGGRISHARPWGGADVVITATSPKAQNGPGFYPDPRFVVTPHARELSWLFEVLRDAFYDQKLLDSMTKIEFFGRLANAALRYQSHCGGTEVRMELLLAVLHEAFAMLDEMEHGTFESLAVACGNAIADDYKEPEVKRGFMSISGIKKFFAERGIEVP